MSKKYKFTDKYYLQLAVQKHASVFNKWDSRLHRNRSTTTKKEYPRVRKTGVDAVHEKLPTEGVYHEENVIYNVCNIDHRWWSKGPTLKTEFLLPSHLKTYLGLVQMKVNIL